MITGVADFRDFGFKVSASASDKLVERILLNVENDFIASVVGVTLYNEFSENDESKYDEVLNDAGGVRGLKYAILSIAYAFLLQESGTVTRTGGVVKNRDNSTAMGEGERAHEVYQYLKSGFDILRKKLEPFDHEKMPHYNFFKGIYFK